MNTPPPRLVVWFLQNIHHFVNSKPSEYVVYQVSERNIKFIKKLTIFRKRLEYIEDLFLAKHRLRCKHFIDVLYYSVKNLPMRHKIGFSTLTSKNKRAVENNIRHERKSNSSNAWNLPRIWSQQLGHRRTLEQRLLQFGAKHTKIIYHFPQCFRIPVEVSFDESYFRAGICSLDTKLLLYFDGSSLKTKGLLGFALGKRW